MTSKEEQKVGSGEEREDIAGAGAESDEAEVLATNFLGRYLHKI